MVYIGNSKERYPYPVTKSKEFILLKPKLSRVVTFAISHHLKTLPIFLNYMLLIDIFAEDAQNSEYNPNQNRTKIFFDILKLLDFQNIFSLIIDLH